MPVINNAVLGRVTNEADIWNSISTEHSIHETHQWNLGSRECQALWTWPCTKYV